MAPPLFVSTVLALVLCAGLPARAQQKPGAAARAELPRAGQVDDKPTLEKLTSGEPAQVMVGLSEAQARGPLGSALAPPIEQLLMGGASAPVMRAAIDALGAIGATSSSAVLRPFVGHRAEELRHAAVRALANTGGLEATLAYREGLRSGDPAVRGLSATGLGLLGVKDAVPDLFLALDRKVVEAAAAIGRLCEGAECERFADKLGSISLEVMTDGFDAMFFRGVPLPDEILVAAVGRVRALGTVEARRYLSSVDARWPSGGSPRVREAVLGAISSLAGAAK